MTFPSDYEHFIYKSRYARWDDEKDRREDYPETVDRYIDFMKKHLLAQHNYTVPEATEQKVRRGLRDMAAVPSMRAFMTAGEALERTHMAGYNCSYLAVDAPDAFWESMQILLCGTGVGYSVERQFTDQLPTVADYMEHSEAVIAVEDSKEGWVDAFRTLIQRLYRGEVCSWDTSKVRPAGARLKVFGGRASGPEPLEDLFRFCVDLFSNATGRKLEPIECHDIMCKIADIVVVGGVRRSAMISLNDLNDEFLAKAKSPIPVLGQDGDEILVQYNQFSTRWFKVDLNDMERDEVSTTGQIGWWKLFPHRALANISAVHEGKPDAETFLREWTTMIASKAGERGFFNREAAETQVLRNGRRKGGYAWGTNPCAEIILRSCGVCNLSEVIVRAEDTLETLMEKVEVATIFGTWQSTLTNFKGLRPIWRENAEEERLLGVSLTGIMDHPLLAKGDAHLLSVLRERAVEVNREQAEAIGISASAAVTCVKPSGTVSQLTNTASGIHTRHSAYYIRTVRGDRKDPITQFLMDQSVPHEPCVLRPENTVVFSFPIAAPEVAIVRDDLTAIDQLEIWKKFQDHWCEHKPSCTVTVRDEEWIEVAAWVYKNFDDLSGISFLPHTDHVYAQAPYQEIKITEYEAAKAKMPAAIQWERLKEYEQEDTTQGVQQLACSAGVCEIVDLSPR